VFFVELIGFAVIRNAKGESFIGLEKVILKEMAVPLRVMGVKSLATMAQNPDSLIPTRRSLLSRLKNWEDQESWKEFFATYCKLVYAVAARRTYRDEAQDVVAGRPSSRVAKQIAGI